MSANVNMSEENMEEADVKDNSSTSAENSLNEYETQLLGFTPVTLINGMYNSVCDLYREALKAFCTAIQEKYPGVMTEEELNGARHAIGQQIDKDINEVFDKLEIFTITNVFTIPDECVLPEDMCQLLNASSKDDEMEEKIRQVKKRIVALKYANARLSRQLETAEAFRGQLDKIVASVHDFKQGGSPDVNIKDVLTYFSDTIMEAFHKNKPSSSS